MVSEDFGYTCDGYGYMITYQGKPIGGAGVLNRNGRKDYKTHEESADATIRQCRNLDKTRPFTFDKYKGMWEWFKGEELL
jgi:hypothetical protein